MTKSPTQLLSVTRILSSPFGKNLPFDLSALHIRGAFQFSVAQYGKPWSGSSFHRGVRRRNGSNSVTRFRGIVGYQHHFIYIKLHELHPEPISKARLHDNVRFWKGRPCTQDWSKHQKLCRTHARPVGGAVILCWTCACACVETLPFPINQSIS